MGWQIMAKIYLPTDLLSSDCKVVNNDYIRVYTNTQHTNYTDVYFKSGYLLKNGQTTNPYNLVCDNINTYTDNIFYRFDTANSLLIFFIIVIICFWFPFRIFSRAFGRWLRV